MDIWIYEIKHYNTDISNWGEDDNLKLKGVKICDNTNTFKDILDIAFALKAPIIIKTSYKSEKKPGAWYIKGTKNTEISYDTIKLKCEENHNIKKYCSRDCWLIKYNY